MLKAKVRIKPTQCGASTEEMRIKSQPRADPQDKRWPLRSVNVAAWTENTAAAASQFDLVVVAVAAAVVTFALEHCQLHALHLRRPFLILNSTNQSMQNWSFLEFQDP